MRKRKLNKRRYIDPYKVGSSIIETVAGILILMPIFLLLVDVIALVIAQSINDDLSKQAARYAGQYNNVTDATNNALEYVANTPYATAANGLITNAIIPSGTINYNNNGNNQVQVITQINCNLPIPVPFGGPSSTTFQSQYTTVITALQP